MAHGEQKLRSQKSTPGQILALSRINGTRVEVIFILSTFCTSFLEGKKDLQMY
jgi:hypothetical protein